MKLSVALSIILSILISPIIYGQSQSYLFRPDGANFAIYNNGSKNFILNQSKFINKNIDKVMEQLSSGKRLNKFQDNPATMAVLEKMNAILKGLQAESMSAANMRNFYRYVGGAIAQNMSLINRIEGLIQRSGNGILTAEDRGYNQTEIDQLLRQIDMNAKFSQFNKIAVIQQLTTKNLGIDRVDVVHNLYKSYDMVQQAKKKLMRRRVMTGVKNNILTFRIKGVTYHYLNLLQAASRSGDMDISEGFSNLMKNSIKIQVNNGILLKGK